MPLLISTGRVKPLIFNHICPCFTQPLSSIPPSMLQGLRITLLLQCADGMETSSRLWLHLPDTLCNCNLFGSCPFPGAAVEEAGPSASEQSTPQTHLAFCCFAGALAQSRAWGSFRGPPRLLSHHSFLPSPFSSGVRFYP